MLKNSFHTQLAIGILLDDEKELEDKLNLLTEISIVSSGEETLRICENFRERLCTVEMERKRHDALPGIGKGRAKRNCRNEKPVTGNGEE